MDDNGARDKFLLDNLPTEVLVKIAQFLGTIDILTLSEVNWMFYRLTANKIFMKNISLVIKDNISEAYHALSFSGRQYENLVLNSVSVPGCSDEHATLFWSIQGMFLRCLHLENCEVIERVLTDILKCCPSLSVLHLVECDSVFMSGRLMANPVNWPLLPKLMFLDISNNRYLSDSLLSNLFHQSPNLRGLDISKSHMSFNSTIYRRFYPSSIENKNTPSESILTFQNMMEYIKNGENKFIHLNLSNTMIDDIAFSIVVNAPNIQLEELILNHCPHLTVKSMFRICELVHLKTLNVDACHIFHKSSPSLLPSICQSLKYLTDFSLSGSGNYSQIINPGILSSLSQLAFLERLTFNFYCDRAVDEIIMSLRSTNRLRLKYLNLACCGINDNTIVNSLPFIHNLMYLNVSQNSIGDVAMTSIITHLPKLETLLANWCKISDLGFTSHADRIGICKLKHVELQGTRISDDSLINFFTRLYYLRVMNINNCSYVTDSGIQYVLTNCPHLKVFIHYK